MSELFLDILNGSIAAGWLILGILIARVLLKKAPRRLICGLWALVAVRLLLPWTIQSPVSLVPSAQTISPASMYDHEPVINSGVELVDDLINPVYTDSLRTDGLSSINPLQVWTAVGANIWFLGMLAMLLWACISWLRIRRRVQERVLLEGNIWLCDRIDTPFIFGFFAPKIYLPSALSQEIRGHVIAHERAHLARRDHWWKPLGFALLTVHWFNPLMWAAYLLLCRDIELACDERVIRDMGLDAKKRYSAALLQCSVSPRMIAACPLAFGEVGVKQRIRSVLHYKKPAFWIILISLVVLILLAVGFLTDPVPKDPVIRWDGVYYDLSGSPVSQIDPQFVSEGSLVSILHDSTPLPDTDAQAINLDWEYAGCEVYRNPTDPQRRVLYLQQPGEKGYLPFSLRTPNELLRDILEEAPKIRVNVSTDNTETTEVLLGDRDISMKGILHNLENIEFLPGALPYGGNVSLHIHPENDYGNGIQLERANDNTWELYIINEEYGPSSWLFTCEELNDALLRYETRAEYGNAFFSDPVYDDPNRNVHIGYENYYDNGLHMTAGIPYAVVEWEHEDLKPGLGDEFVGFRCRPAGKTGWLNVMFYPNIVDALLLTPREEPMSNPSGTRYCSGDGTPELYQLDTTRGQLLARAEDTADWTGSDWTVAEFILSTITLYDSDGANLLDSTSNKTKVPDTLQADLGITLHAENVTPSGLTLVCMQDGVPLSQLITGTPYTIERLENGEWTALLFPEGTAWTMEGIGVPIGDSIQWDYNWSRFWGELPPGQYRISKFFTGTLANPGVMGYIPRDVDQTCYAEFTIE